MSVYAWLKAFALVGVPAGLLLGLALGLVANRQDGWGGYGSLRRRAARLGHVAAVALPLLAGFYAVASGIFQVARIMPTSVLGAALIVLMGVSYLKAGRIEDPSV